MQPEVQHVHHRRARHAECHGVAPGAGRGRDVGPGQHRQRHEQRGRRHLAARRHDHRPHLRERALRHVGRESVEHRRQQGRHHRPPVSPARQPRPREHEHAGEAHGQPDEPQPPRALAEPQEADEGPEERHGCVQHRRQPCRQRQRGVGEQRERNRRVDRADQDQRPGRGTSLSESVLAEEQRQQDDGGDHHPHGDERHRSEGWRGDPHEQERGPPQRPECDEVDEVAGRHAHRQCRRDQPRRRVAEMPAGVNILPPCSARRRRTTTGAAPAGLAAGRPGRPGRYRRRAPSAGRR